MRTAACSRVPHATAKSPDHSSHTTCTARVVWPENATQQSRHRCAAVQPCNAVDQEQELRSAVEQFVDELDAEPVADSDVAQLQHQLSDANAKLGELQRQLDDLHNSTFSGVEFSNSSSGAGSDSGADTGEPSMQRIDSMTEADFAALGRDDPAARKALLAAKEAADPKSVQRFQSAVVPLRLQRTRLKSEIEALQTAIEQARANARTAANLDDNDDEGAEAADMRSLADTVRIVMVTGFESFNVDLYKKAAKRVAKECPGVKVFVFSDRDIGSRQAEVVAALDGADVFFGSLLFDYDQVEWLKDLVEKVPIRLVFESALELMSCTQVGTFQMDPSGRSKGPPPAVKKVLSMFGSGREEDKMVGYLSFLKIGPKLLRFLPGNKARDLRNWLQIYAYWNEGGMDNVVTMLLYLVDQYLKPTGIEAAAVQVTPPTGCLHPDHTGFFDSPAEYLRWYHQHGPVQDAAAPTVAILLYRKHVITQQLYIEQLVQCLEAKGIRPVPIFINGVEAHTIVRDQLTTEDEQKAIKQGRLKRGLLKRDAISVDAIVSTIGFPLVGGPAGTMEGGRQADIAKGILAAKNVPYVVAAPLLIQDMASWTRDGIAGLQSVVLYSLPELDGAIDTVPLGGLVGDNIFLVEERVQRLADRLKKWVALRRTPPQDRKLAILLYGFPPGVGATGTAALLNVPRSLERTLEALRQEGYDVGSEDGTPIDGESIVAALQAQEQQRVVSQGAKGISKLGTGDAAAAAGAQSVGAEVSPKRLKEMLTYPPDWGPTEWGPIPFLPTPDILVQRMERQWGDLSRYRGIQSTAKGDLLVNGIQQGNIWIGVQPALGVEGDPMRMLFERDLTPHPQYAAFYKWLEQDYGADAVLHFGMHGTVEWLPGAPLGNSGLSWSDVLLSTLPNIYVYAANNPSESIIAKRRGYGTIISHNVPPYGRAGLYKQLSELKSMLAEVRDDAAAVNALKEPIAANLEATGLGKDCPFQQGAAGQDDVQLTTETVEGVSNEEFAEYASRLYQYLQVIENRLFSEGLHVLGRPPAPQQMAQYLEAYFDGGLSEDAVSAIVQSRDQGLEATRKRLEQLVQRSPETDEDHSSQIGAADRVEEAFSIAGLLDRNTEELGSLLRALNGEYVLPEAGGDLLRDGAGVLPTGRNIHALDPYRMPNAAALQRGTDVGRAILEAHQAANDGKLPETVAVNLWGLDAIKTKGESVAIVLHLVGARPVREGTGRIARFELIPLEDMGRPRVDVLCNMSGIFRDSFQNVVELLDDLFQRAATADEPADMNYIRKHSSAMTDQGLTNSAARLFSNPAGDYGSMVNEQVGTSEWESGEELGSTWQARNAFSYGRGQERGQARPEVLQELLSTTQRIVQEVDSVEYGLTDIQEYYANTGALKRAAESAQGGKRVSCSVVEAFGDKPKPQELEQVLRLEYRSKLLNPKWANAMADQGSGGAYEISQRMTAMIGWGGTADFKEDWAYDQAAETYAFDQEMARRLQKANPQAFGNILKRMLEAAGRGMWNADEQKLERLRSMYADIDSQIEGV